MKCSHCPWTSSDKNEFYDIKVSGKKYPLCSECYIEFLDCMNKRRVQKFLREIKDEAKKDEVS